MWMNCGFRRKSPSICASSVHTLYQWRGRNMAAGRKMGKHLRYLRQDVSTGSSSADGVN